MEDYRIFSDTLFVERFDPFDKGSNFHDLKINLAMAAVRYLIGRENERLSVASNQALALSKASQTWRCRREVPPAKVRNQVHITTPSRK